KRPGRKRRRGLLQRSGASTSSFWRPLRCEWLEERHMLSSINPVGGEVRINTSTNGAQDLPQIAKDAVGDYVIVWQSQNQDGNGYGIYAQRYNAAGKPQGAE